MNMVLFSTYTSSHSCLDVLHSLVNWEPRNVIDVLLRLVEELSALTHGRIDSPRRIGVYGNAVLPILHRFNRVD